MAINLNEEVSSRMDAYRANPGALQKRYQSNQELLDLLALQKLTAEKKKAQQELQAAMQQDPRTIKQQLEQEALGMTKDEMAQQLGGIGKTIQTQQQKNLQRVAAGVGQPQGLESLTPPNAPRTPQPTQPTARMAGGGIVSLASGGLTEEQERERRQLGWSYEDYYRYLKASGYFSMLPAASSGGGAPLIIPPITGSTGAAVRTASPTGPNAAYRAADVIPTAAPAGILNAATAGDPNAAFRAAGGSPAAPAGDPNAASPSNRNAAPASALAAASPNNPNAATAGILAAVSPTGPKDAPRAYPFKTPPGIPVASSGGARDVLGEHRRDVAEKAYKKERDAIVAKLSRRAEEDEYGQWISTDAPSSILPKDMAKQSRDKQIAKLTSRLHELDRYIDARRRDYPGDFPAAPTDAAPTAATVDSIGTPDVPGSGGSSRSDTTASAPTTSTTGTTAGVPTTGPNINLPRTVVPQTDLSGIRQLMNAGPYGDGTSTSTRTSILQESGLAGLDKQAPVDQAQRQAAYDQRFGRADEAARYADFEKQLTALQDKRRAQDSDFFNKFMRFVGEATKGNSGGYGNFARAYIGGLDRESLRERQDLMQVYQLYKEGRARDTDLAKAATTAAAKDMESYLKIKEITANAIANDKKLAVDWRRALLQSGVDLRRIASDETMKQATLDAQRAVTEFRENSANNRTNSENIVKLYGDTSRLIAQVVSEITKRSADILRLNEESIGLDPGVQRISPQQANALAVMSVGESGILDAIDALQRIIVSMGGEPLNFGGSTVTLSPDAVAALKNHPIAGKYVREQQQK